MNVLGNNTIYHTNTLFSLPHWISPRSTTVFKNLVTLELQIAHFLEISPRNSLSFRIFPKYDANPSVPLRSAGEPAYKMADVLPCLSVFTVDNASTAFHHTPGGWVAKLFMAFPFMACCSVSHELLGKIPESYYEPLKPMKLHLLWHKIHITSLVLDHMEGSLLNLA